MQPCHRRRSRRRSLLCGSRPGPISSDLHRSLLSGSQPGRGSRPAAWASWVSAWTWALWVSTWAWLGEVVVVAEFWMVEWVTGSREMRREKKKV
uniref:Uncharacterized protein n=1 Tax=Fagus sylvatica TaxID=28930 RepID=A0A2N9FAG4_FAGSY